jgi:hypothetical protein
MAFWLRVDKLPSLRPEILMFIQERQCGLQRTAISMAGIGGYYGIPVLVDRKGRRMGFPRRVLGREVMMMIPSTVTVRVDLLLFAMMTFEMSMIRFRLE